MELPYDGDLQDAHSRGDDLAVRSILHQRNHTGLDLAIPTFDIELQCEVTLDFLNEPGNSLCIKEKAVIDLLNKSNTYKIKNIPLKKFSDDVFFLQEDVLIVSEYKEIIAIPVHDKVYTLQSKEDYDRDYVQLYYAIYNHIYWLVNRSSSNLSYSTFKNYDEDRILAMIKDVIDSA